MEPGNERWVEIAIAHWERKAGPCLLLRSHHWGGETYCASPFHDGPTYLFKRYQLAGFRYLRFLHRCRRAKKVQRQHGQLAAAGFPVPKMVCLLEYKILGFTVGSLSVQEHVADSPNLLEMLRRTSSPSRRKELFHAIGQAVAQLHQCGFYHGELQPPNVLCRMDPLRFCWVDNDRGRQTRHLPHRLARDDLLQLSKWEGMATCTDLRWAWHAYAVERQLGLRQRSRLLRSLLRNI